MPGIPGMEYWERYTDAQLSAAFDRVKPAGNWKLPIDCEVPADSDLTLITDAIIYYTGSHAEFIKVSDTTFRVIAEGYYNAIGS